MAKKSMIDKALEQSQKFGAAGAGFLGARFIEQRVAAQVGTDTMVKQLGVGIGVPVATGIAAQAASDNKYVQAAGLGAFIRGAVVAGQFVLEQAQDWTGGGNAEVQRSQVQRARAVAQLPVARSRPHEEEPRRSGVMSPHRSGNFEVV